MATVKRGGIKGKGGKASIGKEKGIKGYEKRKEEEEKRRLA